MGKKGIILIILILFLLILAVLGWSLVNLQATDVTLNLRMGDAERALYLAEAGGEWALRQLVNDVNWRTEEVVHRLEGGEYKLVCKDSQTEDADVVIEVTGFVPGRENFRASRKVKLSVKIGSLEAVVQAKNLFNWHLLRVGSRINGDVKAGHYDGDGDNIWDERGQDYDPLPPPVLPPDGREDERGFIREDSYPLIDMSYFQNQANIVWRQARETITDVSSCGNVLRVSQRWFFSGMRGEAVRNLTHGSWDDNNWAVIVSVRREGREAWLDRNIGDTWDNDRIRIIKRFAPQNVWFTHWYIKGNSEGTIPGDVVIDARNGAVRFLFSSIVATGDIVIKGSNQVRFLSPQVPCLATKKGDILSLDIPQNSDERNRTFHGLIYSEQGDVVFNYLYGWGLAGVGGTAVMGNNVQLMGRVRIRYHSWFVPQRGFIFSPSLVSWQEE